MILILPKSLRTIFLSYIANQTLSKESNYEKSEKRLVPVIVPFVEALLRDLLCQVSTETLQLHPDRLSTASLQQAHHLGQQFI